MVAVLTRHVAKTAFVASSLTQPAPSGWMELGRTVMMTVGGVVVLALILIVGVAIVSGVLGMIGRLKKTPDR